MNKERNSGYYWVVQDWFSLTGEEWEIAYYDADPERLGWCTFGSGGIIYNDDTFIRINEKQIIREPIEP